MKNIQETKSLLAKLLAMENLTVQHLNVRTASFDTENRVLTLPIWKDMTGDIYDLMTGHEVGHALYTPKGEWERLDKIKGRKFLGFLNIVEDARIEKKIKRKYPGLRRCFSIAYKLFLERDLFGIAKLNGDTSQLNLIDRINLHCKCGSSIVIKFSDEETALVRLVEGTETFEQVLDVTQKIWDYVKDNEQEKINNPDDLQSHIIMKAAGQGQGPKQDSDDSDDGDGEDDAAPQDGDSDENGDKSADSDEKSDDSDGDTDSSEEDSDGDCASQQDGSDDGESEEKDDELTSGGSEGSPGSDDPQSVTDSSFRDKEKDLVDDKALPFIYLDLPECDLTKTIIPFKTIADYYEFHVGNILFGWKMDYKTEASKLLSQFMSRNMTYIALLVKEFEMRKNASQYARQMESKSGELDMRRLARYKFTSDIFRRYTEVPKGKNHGMIMFVDMSISMQPVFRNTMEQALILAMFCKKINIPFEIYGFSDSRMTKYPNANYNTNKFSEKTPTSFSFQDSNFHLKTIISSDMNPRDFQRASYFMMMIGEQLCGYNEGYNARTIPVGTGNMDLNGTPFNETLVASKNVINRFKQKTRVDIINVIYLTDGEGADAITYPEMYRQYQYDQAIKVERTGDMAYRNHRLGFVDPQTKVSVTQNPGESIQTTLTRLIRETTGCRHIGFYISSAYALKRNISVVAEASKADELNKSLTENDFYNYPARGYDSYYYVAAKSALVKNDRFLESKAGSKENIAASFLAFQNKKKKDRILVTKFASEIASYSKT